LKKHFTGDFHDIQCCLRPDLILNRKPCIARRC
jgi:hypothetical protein